MSSPSTQNSTYKCLFNYFIESCQLPKAEATKTEPVKQAKQKKSSSQDTYVVASDFGYSRNLKLYGPQHTYVTGPKY